MICEPYIIFWNQFRIKNIMFSLNWIGMLLSTSLHKWWHSLVIGLSSLWKRLASLSSYLNPTLITDGDAFDQRDRTARGTHLLPVTCLGHLGHNFIGDQCFNLLWLGCLHRVIIRYYCWCYLKWWKSCETWRQPASDTAAAPSMERGRQRFSSEWEVVLLPCSL